MPPLSLKNMPKMMSLPIFIFQRADNAIGILTEMKDRDGKNVCVAIDMDWEFQGGGETHKMNDIRRINGRERSDIVYPILTFFCKLQVLVMLQAQTNLLMNIISIPILKLRSVFWEETKKDGVSTHFLNPSLIFQKNSCFIKSN